MTYAMFLEFQHALHAVLVPMQKKIDAFRASKEPWELELMRKAQEITDLTFAQAAEGDLRGHDRKGPARGTDLQTL